jgi:hypothetical protein
MIKKILFFLTSVLLILAVSSQAQYSYKNTWSATGIYNGSYKVGTGDTVQFGQFNGKNLYWWAQWWSQGDQPGQFAPEGGTSPWVLINSNTFNPTTKLLYKAKVWNSDIATTIAANQAVIPTWRDGAEGAYTIIHDDLGSLTYDNHIKPGVDVNRLHPRIKVSWSVIVGECDNSDWANAQVLLSEGHEMTNHSLNHTSAADQWYWFEPDSTLPTSLTDPAMPTTLGGLKVLAFPRPQTNPGWPGNVLDTVENEIAQVVYTTNWTGVCPKDTILNNPPKIIPKAGTITITLPTGQKQYVRYTKMDTVNGNNTGTVLAWSNAWTDYDAATQNMPSAFAGDQGWNWWVCKIWAIAKWQPAEYKVNIVDAKNTIDTKVYTPLAGKFGPNFPPNMKTSYFCYPYDAFSETTHDSLNANGYVSGRGGAKSGKPMPGDFFHPFRLDFDAFMMFDAQATTIFPANPHEKIGLDAMLDSIIKYKGYMIRELHAVCDQPFATVNDATKGGWWGGITKTLYNSHLTKVDAFIDQNKLTTFNASEAIRYRMTANAATGATLTASGANYTLAVTAGTIPDKYKDEISVIVKLPAACTKMDVKYATADAVWGNHPRRPPRMLGTGGTTWSVNVNPYLGNAVIYPNTDWTGPLEMPIAVKYNVLAAGKAQPRIFQGYRNGLLILSLHPGSYTVDVFAANGQRKISYAGTADMYKVCLRASGLAQGSYLLRATQSDGHIVNAKFSVYK